MKRLRVVILASAAVLIALAVWFTSSKMTVVDMAPAVAFADDYFAELEAGNMDVVFEMYAPGLGTGEGESWRRLLNTMKDKFGNVTAKKLQKSSIVPKDSIPCTLMQYQVTRLNAPTTENLIVCPAQGSASYAVYGHEVINPAGQRIATGLTVQLL